MEIHVSVRELVGFILREGNIDNRRTAGADAAMQEGSRIHRMIQRSMGSEYHAEVPLKIVWNAGEYDIAVEGRADGIIDFHYGNHSGANAERSVVIDEIKGTYKDLRRITKPVGVHLAQAKCYAYIYAKENRLSDVGVRITYCNIETEEKKYFDEKYTLDALCGWFDKLLTEYKKWADFRFEWEKRRTASIKGLEFPFAYREGQKELASYAYQTIYHKRKLFLEAPTGVGKTISTVFPAIKAMGEGMAEKIFYLTAKTITRTVAQECFALLRAKGLCIKTVTLTARDKICFLKEDDASNEAECNPDACPFACGHYDRINDAMYDLLVHEDSFSREQVKEYAKKHNVCPFELSLDMSLFADAIICDYNYAFDPRVYLKRFFGENSAAQNYVFLIDEAHNLLERGREMYSASLLKNAFLAAKRLLKDASPKTAKLLEKCNKELLAMKRRCEYKPIREDKSSLIAAPGACCVAANFNVRPCAYKKEEGIDGFVNALVRAYSAIDDLLDENEGSKLLSNKAAKNELLEFYFNIAHFLNMYEIMDSHYIAYSMLMDDGDFMLKLFCVDPSENLGGCMLNARSSILFSATLLPIQYYKSLLGGEAQDYEVYAKSTFNEEKKALFVANDVTSKYTRRNEGEFRKIARYIYEIVRERHGNYMVFLPSHQFLERVYECFMGEYFDRECMECIVQEDYMSEAKREEFLMRFQGNEECDLGANIAFEIEEDDDRILIGFCVMGGIFSEGIDLKYDSLIGAIIVGTGIPQVSGERELLKQYFDERGGNGFDYAYRYPGMNKVLQSAGRVIRTADDVGIVVLLDERFLEHQYRRLFPREWRKYEVVDVESISGRVEKFWNEWL